MPSGSNGCRATWLRLALTQPMPPRCRLRPNGTTHAHLHVVQSVHHAADDARIDGYDTTKHTSGSTTIGRSEKKSFVFNHGGQARL